MRRELHPYSSARKELAQSLLLTLNLFEFADFIDSGCEQGLPRVTKIVHRFFADRHGMSAEQANGVLPFLTGPTTLSVLTFCFSFGSAIDDDYWETIGFTIEERFGMTVLDYDASNRELTPRTALEVISSACKEYAGTALDARFHPTIDFVGHGITFTAPGLRLKFSSTLGLGAFVQAYVRALRRAIREKLLK